MTHNPPISLYLWHVRSTHYPSIRLLSPSMYYTLYRVYLYYIILVNSDPSTITSKGPLLVKCEDSDSLVSSKRPSLLRISLIFKQCPTYNYPSPIRSVSSLVLVLRSSVLCKTTYVYLMFVKSQGPNVSRVSHTVQIPCSFSNEESIIRL